MLDKIDPWFLQIAVLGLFTFSIWSLRNVLTDFKEQVKGLKDTITRLFERGDDHEHRLSRLEGRCAATHGVGPDGGRRYYDPNARPDQEA